MLDEEEQNDINKTIAIIYTIGAISNMGYKNVMLDIDVHKDVHVRAYFRKLVHDAVKVMKRDNIPIKK